jgi:hypothetical protein
MELQADDMAVGMHITILHGRKWKPCYGQPANSVAVAEAIWEDISWKGDVLVIRAVSLPYIVVDCLTGCCQRRINLDTRERKFCRLSDEYVAAAIKQPE